MKKRNTQRIKALRVAVVGAAGRMGQRIIACAAAVPQVRVVAAVDAAACPAIGRDAGALAGIGDLGVIVTSDLAAACRGADVVIDFALADGLAQRVGLYAKRGVPCVVGTTGVDDAVRAAIARAAKKIAVIHAPNFSVGVNLLFQLAARAAAVLDEGFDVEIVEMHHRRKQDAPSGTALRLVEMVEDAQHLARGDHRVYGRQGVTGARPAREIGVHALRGGDVVGDHTVVFAAEGERVELTHKASSRDTFARGAVRAALFLAGRKPGMYTMNDVLGF